MNAEQTFPIEGVPVDVARTDMEAPRRRNGVLAWLSKRRWFALFVILPTLLAAVYYGMFASDIYVSESRFVIKSPDQKRSSVSSLANLMQTTGLSGGQEQANEVLDFVRSRDALRAIEKTPGQNTSGQNTSGEKTAGARAAWSAPHGDFLASFPQPFTGETFEELFKFYGKMVDARLDTETSTAIITVKAFTPQDAYAINTRLLNLSEDMVNRLSARAQGQGVTEAQKQVDLATERAKAARVALGKFRNSQEVIDPAKQAVGIFEIANVMIAQRAALQAQLDQMQQVTPNNPSIPALRQRISAISAQIAGQDSRAVGSSTGIASKMGGYDNLLVEEKFATENLTAASAALVQARAEAAKQQFYLEHVVDPNLPDDALMPRRFLDTLIVAAVATCLYFIGWMLIVGMLEHAPGE